ncbi:hypothetical protein AtNW77_Chr3g0183441 [Arabidopsis thaliana]
MAGASVAATTLKGDTALHLLQGEVTTRISLLHDQESLGWRGHPWSHKCFWKGLLKP